MTDQSAARNPLRRPRFIAAAIVIVALIIVAIVLVLSNLLGGSKPPLSGGISTSPSPSPSQSAAADSPPSKCGLKDYAANGTVTTAPSSKWSLVGTVAAPTDPSGSGPGVTESNGFRSCFAHTPKGALYAAANILAVASDQSLLKQLAQELVVPGVGRDALLAQSGAGSDPTAVRYQIAGFKVDSYSGIGSTVDIVVNTTAGSFISFPLQLQWINGDWRVKATATGGFTLQPTQLQNLGGYIPWAGA